VPCFAVFAASPLIAAIEEVSRLLNAYTTAILTSSSSGF
jgi:hypothetical protein